MDDSRSDRTFRTALVFLAFAVVLAMTPFTSRPTIDIKILVYSWGGSLLAMGCVIECWRRKRLLRRPKIFLGILLIFLSIFLVACLRSEYRPAGIVEISRFASLFILYLVATQVLRTPKHVQRLMLAFCIAVGLSVLYGFAQRAGLDPFPWDTKGLEKAIDEMPGTFGHGNIAAHAVVLCIIMAAYLGTVSKGMRWCLGFLPLYVAHMYFSHQRGGLVGVAAALTLLAIVKVVHPRIKRPVQTIAISLGVFAVMGLIAIVGVMGLKYVQSGVPYPTDRPILLRYHAYSGASKMIRERPLLGFGPGNYKIENPRYWTPFEQEHFAVDRKMNYNAHCDVLEIGVEAGLPAAGLYLTFLFVGICYGLLMGLSDEDAARRRFGFVMAAFFCAFMVDGFFGFNLRVPVSASMLFLMAGALEGVWAGSGEEEHVGPTPTLHWLRQGAFLTLALLPACFQTRVFASEFLLQRGKGALEWHAYDDAQRILTQGEALAPWNWEFAHRRGEAALYQHDPVAAIDHFKRALSRHPNRVMVRAALAIATTRHAAGESPPQSPSPVQDLQTQLRVLDEAKARAEDVLTLCPVLPEAERELGRVAELRATLLEQRRSGDPIEILAAWKEVDEHLNRAIEYGATNLDEIYTTLAIAQMRLGKEIEAADSLVRAVNANPSSEGSWATFFQFAVEGGHTDLLRRYAIRAKNRLASAGEEVPPVLKAMVTVWEKGADGFVEATGSLASIAKAQSTIQGGLLLQESLVRAADVLAGELEKLGRVDQETGMSRFNLALVYAAGREWEKADLLFGRSRGLIPEGWPTGQMGRWAKAQMRLTEYAKPDDKARAAIEGGGEPSERN